MSKNQRTDEEEEETEEEEGEEAEEEEETEEEEGEEAEEEGEEAEKEEVEEEEEEEEKEDEVEEKVEETSELDSEIMQDLENLESLPTVTSITKADKSLESEELKKLNNLEQSTFEPQKMEIINEAIEVAPAKENTETVQNEEINIVQSETQPPEHNLQAEQQSTAVDAHQRMKNIVEGALFVAGRPISLEELNVKTEIKKKDLEELINELAMDYLMRNGAMEIIQIQDKYSLQIKAEYTPNVKKFSSGGLIPDAILKTLTIIALKQPLVKSTLIKLRGQGAYDHVKFLLDRGYIHEIRKGRSSELTTSDQFADTFGLSRDINMLKKQMILQLGLPDRGEPSGEPEQE